MRRFLLMLAAVEFIVAGLAAADAPPYSPGSWTLVIMPDTQYYTGANASVFTSQTQWIRNNAATRNIAYVLHEGDVTDNNLAAQWENARTAMSSLDGVVPYALVPGNHDCLNASGQMSNRVSLLSTYFLSQARSMPTFGGTYETDNLNNSYHLFSAGGTDWIVLALEWAPRDAVLTWAGQRLDAYPNRSAIIVTHAYMYSDDTRYDWATKGSSQAWNPHAYNGSGVLTGGTNDGEEIWNKLVKLHQNIVFVFNGHVLNDGAGRLISSATNGNLVHQLLANYQSPIQPNHGGDGYLRLFEFRPDGKSVQVYTYSPYLNACLTDSQQQFVLSLDIPWTPGNPDATDLTPTSLRLTWQDNSDNETGFKVFYDLGSTATTLRATTAADATHYDVTGLLGNAQYTYQIAATNAGGDGFRTTARSVYTLSDPPSAGNNVVCNKTIGQPYPSGTSFSFSNPAGFGTNGPYKVQRFRFIWDSSPTHSFTGSEASWSTGILPRTGAASGDYYLHLRAYNNSGLPNPTTLDYGPFRVDADAPATTADPPGGVYDGSVSVTLTSSEPGSIYYTTDSSDPSTSSSVYTAPIPLAADTELKFYAVDVAGNPESPKHSVTYRVLTQDGRIAEVKRFSPDTPVRLGRKRLYINRGGFGYIEEPDRTSGIRVEGGIPTGLAAAGEGSVVSLVGRFEAPVGSECRIALDAITSSAPADMRPLGVSNSAATSALLTGMSVKVWGKVVPGSIAADSFALSDASTGTGLTVITGSVPAVADGQFVTVAGAMGFTAGLPVIYATGVE